MIYLLNHLLVVYAFPVENFNPPHPSFLNEIKRIIVSLTLYSTMHTKMLRGMRKKFIMVLLASSGMYWDLIFMIDGQNIPTQASNVQKPTS